jgi:hypothetical protein
MTLSQNVTMMNNVVYFNIVMLNIIEFSALMLNATRFSAVLLNVSPLIFNRIFATP